MLALYTIILIVATPGRRPELYPWRSRRCSEILAFFLLVMTVAAPPFQRQVPVPADGRGLNPLLEDTGMITHPIALYLGFNRIHSALRLRDGRADHRPHRRHLARADAAVTIGSPGTSCRSVS